MQHSSTIPYEHLANQSELCDFIRKSEPRISLLTRWFKYSRPNWCFVSSHCGEMDAVCSALMWPRWHSPMLLIAVRCEEWSSFKSAWSLLMRSFWFPQLTILQTEVEFFRPFSVWRWNYWLTNQLSRQQRWEKCTCVYVIHLMKVQPMELEIHFGIIWLCFLLFYCLRARRFRDRLHHNLVTR